MTLLSSVSPVDPLTHPIVVLWTYLISGLIMAINAVATTIAYHDLRGMREDLGGEELAAVFD